MNTNTNNAASTTDAASTTTASTATAAPAAANDAVASSEPTLDQLYATRATLEVSLSKGENVREQLTIVNTQISDLLAKSQVGQVAQAARQAGVNNRMAVVKKVSIGTGVAGALALGGYYLYRTLRR